MPSYMTSTLSLMLLLWGMSLAALILLFTLVGLVNPNAYNLIGQEKTLVTVVVGAYIIFGMQLLSAYLQRSSGNNSKQTIEDDNTIEDNQNTDLLLNKLDAKDTSSK